MRSVKNHLSLIIALFTIVFTMQIYIVVDRTVAAYESELNENYSIVVVTKKKVETDSLVAMSPKIKSADEISTKEVIDHLQSQMKQRHIDLLKLSLPHFYSIHLTHYPAPSEITELRKKLEKNSEITRIEDFAQSHDTLYKLMLLFKSVVVLFAIAIFSVTSLLVLKEMRIWQFQHNERMSIMAMFGAPVWMRSAILFRLSIVDAIIASVLAIGTFIYADFLKVGNEQLQSIGIDVLLFDPLNDSLLIVGVALSLSIILATLIVIGHKEEV
ncbi:MAG: cell division protein FtsX [Sulfurimonadaceae bacterium]